MVPQLADCMVVPCPPMGASAASPRRGFTLHHRLKDLVLLQIAEVLAGRCYRRCMDEPHSGTVVDIGANIGVVALDWAMRLRGVYVHAYEPHPDTYAVLAANVEKNWLSRRITAYCEAVGRYNGTTVLRNSTVSVNNTAYGAGWAGDAHDEFTVPTISFDEVVSRCDAPVELVKIDADGAEADILESASAATLARVRRFVFEYHDAFVSGSLARCARVLASAGFHYIVRSDPSRAGLGVLYASRYASDISLDANTSYE